MQTCNLPRPNRIGNADNNGGQFVIDWNVYDLASRTDGRTEETQEEGEQTVVHPRDMNNFYGMLDFFLLGVDIDQD